MLSKEEFVDYYENKGRCPNDVGQRKGKLNDRQLDTKYKKYVLTQEKQELKREANQIDEEWEEVRTIVWERDNGKCVFQNSPFFEKGLISKLLKEATEDNGGRFLLETIDCAHIFSRASRPDLKYNPDNVILLNRYSHSLIDTMKDPITAEPLDRDSHERWWKCIVGEERYNKLKEIK
jgi:5-methylcytosine-specific restriction endonuclease McrA